MSNSTILLLLKITQYLVIFVICAIVFINAYRLFQKTEGLNKKVTKSIDDSFKKRGRWDDYKTNLSKMGIAYRVGNYNLNPSWYIAARISVGLGVMILAYFVGGGFTIVMPIGFLLGFEILPIYYKHKNKNDNEEMMIDLYQTYANLKIQLGAGIFITRSLEYSHRVAQNRRFKEAMGELILNMADKTVSIDDAINIFKDRFDSREIDKLCALLHNYSQYGASETYTSDIMGEVNAMLAAATLADEHDIETKSSSITFMFFVCILALVGYAMFSQFSGEISFF